MRLPLWGKRAGRPEIRTQAQTAYISGDSSAFGYSAPAIATVEACEGLWSRALASATVTGRHSEALSPEVLALVGRRLIAEGESIWLVAVEGMDVRLRSMSYYSVDAPTSGDPRLWRYSLSDQAMHIKASADEVCHFRINASRSQPWRGRSPWVLARRTREAITGATQALSDEFRIQPQRFLSAPGLLQEDEGKSVFETASSASPGALTVLSGGVEPHTTRIGPEPADAWETLQLMQDTLAGASGVPATLLRGDGQAATQREAWRQFLFGSVAPVAKQIEAEARMKLDSPDLRIEFSELRASDLTGRARALRQLVDAGMTLAEAKQVCGFESVESA